MPDIKTHEEFVAGVQKHLSERVNCPTVVIVHTPMGMEIQTNFADFALQMGILDIAKMTTALAFDRQARAEVGSGQNEAMVQHIKDTIEEKKKVN